MRKNCQGTASRFLAEIYIGCMKVNRSPDVCRKLPLKRSLAATAIDLFALVTFAVAVILLIAAARDFGKFLPPGAVAESAVEVPGCGPDFVIAPWLSPGKAVA
jgi:hypothetical protein